MKLNRQAKINVTKHGNDNNTVTPKHCKKPDMQDVLCRMPKVKANTIFTGYRCNICQHVHLSTVWSSQLH